MWRVPIRQRPTSDAIPLLTVFFAVVVLLAALLSSSCCATDAGSISAAKTWPLVERLTARQAEYVEAGILPDGSPMPLATQMVQRTSLTVLRNVYLAALGRPLEPLPAGPVEPVQ